MAAMDAMADRGPLRFVIFRPIPHRVTIMPHREEVVAMAAMAVPVGMAVI
jgi:hypothetical protein